MNKLRLLDTIGVIITFVGFLIQITLDHWGAYLVMGGLVILFLNHMIKTLIKRKVSQ